MIIKQGPVVEPPVVRYEYSYSYDFRPEKATTKKALESNNSNSPLNILSNAASAVVDEEESVSSSSSQQAQGVRSSSSTLSPSSPPPLKNQALPVVDRTRQLPPIAFAVRRSPPSSAAFGTMISSSPTLSPTLPPPPAPAPVHQQVLLPPHYSPTAYARSLHMPPGMEIPLAAKHPPIPTTVTSSRGKLAAKASSAFVPKVVAKKQTPKYKMKYQYVSMKRSEAIKYIEALSKSGASQVAAVAPPYVPQPWQQQQHPPSPVSVRAPLPAAQLVRPIAVAIPASNARVYHLPLATAVIPRY